MKNIIEFCLKNPLPVLLLAVALVVASVSVARRLPVDVFPEIRVPRVVVQTEAGGLTAEEVEQFITIPVESAMNGVPGVKAVRSSSGGGLSFVWIDFEWGTDILSARYWVSERLASARALIMADHDPEITPVVSVTGEILMLALTSEGEVSPLEIRRLAEFDLRNRLMAIPGIGQVVVMGGNMPEFQVNVEQDRLTSLGLTLNDVIEAARAASTLESAGYLANVRGVEYPLRQTARVETIDDLRRSRVKTGDRSLMQLKDVADVRIGGAQRRGSASYNGQGAIVVSVQKAPGGNTLLLTDAVDRALDSFEATLLPDGVVLHRSAYRQADFIDISIENCRAIVTGAVLIVILVIGLTLMRVRTTVVTLLAMPLSMALGVLIFPRFGLGLNIMTLGGLAVAVGDVVDNAIIFVEIAWRRLGENYAKPEGERLSRIQVLAASGGEILHSVTYSTMIILLVFLPLLFLQGLEGEFFRPLGLAYLLIFGSSLVVALTFIPALAMVLFRNSAFARSGRGRTPGGDGITVRILKGVYRPLLEFSMHHSITVCSVMAAVTALFLWLASTFGTSFLPPFREDVCTVFVSAIPGTSLDETERVSNCIAAEIGEIKGVLSVTRRTGRSERDEHAEPVSTSELVVRLDMNEDYTRIYAAIHRIIDNLPGLSAMIGYPIAHRISSVLSGTNAELALNIYGDDLSVLREAAKRVKAVLDEMPEVTDIRANREILIDTVRIKYRLDDLARAGLSLGSAGNQVAAAFNGVKTGEVAINQSRWDVVVRLDEQLRNEVGDVAAFQLSTDLGTRVRLDEVADVYLEKASNLIVRDNTRRKALISCNVAPGSNMGDLVQALQTKVAPVVNELGCAVAYGGTYEAQQSATRRLVFLGIVILLVIVLLLYFNLRSIRTAVLVLMNLPLSLIGGILAVYLSAPAGFLKNTAALLSGGDYLAPVLSVASIVGFVTVAGFVVRNGLLLLNRFAELRRQGLNRYDAVHAGSQERMVPIIMTSLTTVLGLVPIILAADRPGGELLAPLAVVQFGGLISATVLNLIVLPGAYLLTAGRE